VKRIKETIRRRRNKEGEEKGKKNTSINEPKDGIQQCS